MVDGCEILHHQKDGWNPKNSGMFTLLYMFRVPLVYSKTVVIEVTNSNYVNWLPPKQQVSVLDLSQWFRAFCGSQDGVPTAGCLCLVPPSMPQIGKQFSTSFVILRLMTRMSN